MSCSPIELGGVAQLLEFKQHVLLVMETTVNAVAVVSAPPAVAAVVVFAAVAVVVVFAAVAVVVVFAATRC